MPCQELEISHELSLLIVKCERRLQGFIHRIHDEEECAAITAELPQAWNDYQAGKEVAHPVAGLKVDGAPILAPGTYVHQR